jgi:Putative metal-binding motif
MRGAVRTCDHGGRLVVSGSIGTALICMLLSGCGSEVNAADPLQFSSIHDGDYLGGLQGSTVEVMTSQTVERTELYLDGARIAADEFAPFELQWDTREFPDGAHDLMARADLGDGTRLYHTIKIQIDNTPPILGDVPASATVGEPFVLDATDNGEVSRVEVSLPGEPPIVLTATPYSTAWQWGCGPVSIDVRVVDAAGGETTRAAVVTAIDPKDRDCDLHKALEFGGDDCNDTDPEIHPGADEKHDLVDRNCNGIAGVFDGVDLDHDGVASVASGGTDCDDSNPAIHGGVVAYYDEPLVVGGQPLTWSPGEAVFSSDFGSSEMFLVRAGVVEHLLRGAAGAALEQVAPGANPSSIGAADDVVAFGHGSQVILLTRGAGHQWVSHGSIDADGPVGRLAYARDRDTSSENIVFQAGTKVWFASTATGAWVSQLLVDAGEPLAQSPALSTSFGTVTVVFRTSHAAWAADVFPTEPPPSAFVDSLGPDGAVPTAIVSASFSSLVAVVQGDGAAVYQSGSSAPVLTLTNRVIGMYEQYPYLYVQTEGQDLQLFNVARSFHPWNMVTGVGAFDTASFDAFASSGHIYHLNARSVFPAIETDGDRIDSNCDGFDD